MNQNIKISNENVKEKIVEKDKVKLKYKQKLELVKQHYAIAFNIKYFDNYSIDKIKFTDLDYRNKVTNISIVYDNKVKNFNYIYYEYNNDSEIRNINDKRIINYLNKEKKLKLVVAEINKLNFEYLNELKKIDDNYSSDFNTDDVVLEIKKKNKNG